MFQNLVYIYLINCLLIIAICFTELKKIQMNYFAIYGIVLIAYPSSSLEIISLLGLQLPELTLMAILWLPVCILGLNLILSSGSINFRPTVILLMIPTWVALVNGVILNQTTLYPLLFLILTLPFLRTYGPEKLSLNIRNLICLAVSIRLIFHCLAVILQVQPQVGNCRADKCNFFGAVITPFGVQSNFMSMTFALMAPFLLYFLSGRKLILASIAILINVNLTGGRTGLFAAVLVVLTVLLMKSNIMRNIRGIYSAVLGICLLISLIPIVFSFPNEAFSGRGFLWRVAKAESTESPFLGAGPSFWVRLSENSSMISYYSAHNLWLEVATSAGIIAAVCFFFGFVHLLYSVPNSNRGFMLPIIISFVICGTFEAPVLPYRLIQNPGFYFFLLYMSSLKLDFSSISKARHGEN